MWAPSQAILVQPWTILSSPGYFLSRPGAEGRKDGPCGLAEVFLAVELTMGACVGVVAGGLVGQLGPGLPGCHSLGTQPQAAL